MMWIRSTEFFSYSFGLALMVVLLSFYACGGDGGESGEGTGSFAVQLVFPEDIPRKDGSGRSALTGIIANSGLRISVTAEDGAGEALLQGEAGNVTIQPGQTTIGQIVLSYVDSDQDGFNIKQDCDDKNAAVFPGAEEICGDEIDQDCDADDAACDDSFDDTGNGEPESGTEDEIPQANGESESGSSPQQNSFTNSLGMTFNLIPAGTFVMGSPYDELNRMENEVPHEVTLRSFYVQTTEVTQDQWMEVMENGNPSEFYYCGLSCPVERVSWEDVQL